MKKSLINIWFFLIGFSTFCQTNGLNEATLAQKSWLKLGYGMFIHFGPNTIQGKDWGDGKFPPSQLVFPQLNVTQWAQVAKNAGMKYAILTTKHHDGFCMWNSSYTDYCTKNSPSQKDIVKEFVNEFRKQGIKVGFYYSLWDKNYPDYENDSLYNKYLFNQVTELATNYGEILEFWFDGAWDKDHPTRTWEYDKNWEKNKASGLLHGERYEWEKLYKLIHKLQPHCIVISNSSSDRPGEVKYMPVDARTAEHFDFIFKEKRVNVEAKSIFTDKNGKKYFLPIEFCTTLTPGWFWKEQEYFNHPSVATIIGWLETAKKYNGNLLLNVGPDKNGLIPTYNQYYLQQVKEKLNGK